MFCDLVGSTPLSTRFDPEDLREILGPYHHCVADAVARFSGFVAKYMGDGVLVYFGYPEAHEDDAERAVRAGLAVIDAIGRLATPEPLSVRLGIATGLAVASGIPELNFPSIKGNAISSAADSLTHTPNSQNGGGIGLPSIKDASRDTVALVVGQVVDQLGHLPLAQGELCFALVVITIRRSKTTREAPAARSGSRADSLTHTQTARTVAGSGHRSGGANRISLDRREIQLVGGADGAAWRWWRLARRGW
jgi:hypothetical protein